MTLNPLRAYAHRRYLERLRKACSGQRILLTGASSGIGRAFALHAGAAGGRLVLVARRGEELGAVANEVRERGGHASVRVADLGDTEQCRQLAATVLRDEGCIDILIHNAGLSLRRSIDDLRAGDIERLVAVNFVGPANLTMALLPAMLDQGRGHIVQVSTIGVQTGAPNFAAYVAAKAAADHFARTVRLECRRRGVDVSTLHLPLVRSPMAAATPIYDAFPALALERAARRLGWAVVKRPIRVTPRWSLAVEMLQVASPSALQWLFDHCHDPLHDLIARRARSRRTELEHRSRPDL